MSMEKKYMVISWDYVDSLCRRVAIDILKDGFVPSCVVALAKGGLFAGTIVSDYLGSELICLDIRKAKEIRGDRVLIVDDFINTGRTMERAVDIVHADEVRTASLLMLESSKFIPDYLGDYLVDYAWIIFPWNFVEDVSNIVLDVLRREKESSQSKLKTLLSKKGLDLLNLEASFPGRFEEVLKILELKRMLEKKVEDGRIYWRILE